MKYILILLIACFGLTKGYSQEGKGQYLFQEFSEGYVYYKDGRVFKVPLNYDLTKGKFYFIDKDKEKKEFSDPNMVTSVKVGERIFLPVSGNEAAEVIQSNPNILVQYSGAKRIKRDITFGGKTETASVDSYSNLIYSTPDVVDESNVFVANLNYKYFVEKDGRMKKFSNAKQFIKIFSKRKGKVVRYIEENKVDFDSIEQVVKLCNYAISLR